MLRSKDAQQNDNSACVFCIACVSGCLHLLSLVSHSRVFSTHFVSSATMHMTHSLRRQFKRHLSEIGLLPADPDTCALSVSLCARVCHSVVCFFSLSLPFVFVSHCVLCVARTHTEGVCRW